MKRTIITISLVSFILLTFTSCDNEPLVLNKKIVKLYQGETFQLELVSSKTRCVSMWQSSNEPYVSVSSEGLITARYVGEADITAENQVCKVKVLPRITEIDEPYFEPYASKEDVTKNMGAMDDGDDKITYHFHPLFDQLTYNFNDNGELTYLDIYLSSLENADMIVELYKERYQLAKEDCVENYEDYWFVNVDAITVRDIKLNIGLEVDKENDEIYIYYSCD